MLEELNNNFKKSLETGFLDKDISSEIVYQPELLVNRKNPPKKVLSTILDELNNCEAFFISVAFATSSGVATLTNTLFTLQEKGVKGQILVSDYLKFTEPEALRKLLKFENIELRISTNENSHSKGYIFQSKNYFNLVIGSSNLTANALSTNKEWNLKVSGLNSSAIVDKVLNEFKIDFGNGEEVTLDFIKSYSLEYEKRLLSSKEAIKKLGETVKVKIEPNSMQVVALENLKFLRSQNKTKALLISATGTGKTFLSAFDANEFQPKKLLFVVHRFNIANKSLESFQQVFGKQKSMGIYSGNRKELDCDFIFSTVQTISKEENLNQFSKSHFDYIIIDESHRSGADSYQRLIEYFEPKFLLGMTATPERTDGVDIFSLFDHNIAYEIRLNRAMEEDMLSQFHYFGVTDLIIDEKIRDNTTDFSLLTTEDRVDKIIEKADFYGSDNGITRGLVFCSRNEEAKAFSDKFNERGFRTIALSGSSSEEERENSMKKLESDDLSNKLDYIFTVDIFNEGIDIPKVNQILMIRPTESAIIFVQQLGRGLRKAEGKGFLTIVDFIGNYKNNYLIPVALFGDTSYNKDALRKLISAGSTMIPGASTINFDEITKARIFESIDSANMQLFKDLKNDYSLLKYKLGRIPMMMDFPEHGSRDPFLFVDYSRSFFNFVHKVEKDFEPKLSNKTAKVLELFTREINNAKRVEESLILKMLIIQGTYNRKDFINDISIKYGYSPEEKTIVSCVENLNFKFVRESKNKKLVSVNEVYNLDILFYENGEFFLAEKFKQELKNEQFSAFLLDSISYSIYKYDREFKSEDFINGFLLYKKYSRKDVFRILNFKENPVAQNVGGYLVHPDFESCPIFVNYHKEESISESTKYEDEFINQREFKWMSKSNRKVESKDVQAILGKNGLIRLPLFIKKSNDEGLEFYYMGDMNPNLNKVVPAKMKNDDGKSVSVVKIDFDLKTPVIDNIYNYITETKTSPVIEKEVKATQKQLDFEVVENMIPLYDFHAAAGDFSEMQYEKNYSLIPVSEKYSDKDYFACKVLGDSMNRRIPNGSIALFKVYNGGSRNGKIMLIENTNKQDPDFNSQFTVKTYTSEKIGDDENWEHGLIVLRPNSYDPSYKDITVTAEVAQDMRTVGEFIEILK